MRACCVLYCVHARGLADACVKGQYVELTLVEQRAQIDQVI